MLDELGKEKNRNKLNYSLPYRQLNPASACALVQTVPIVSIGSNAPKPLSVESFIAEVKSSFMNFIKRNLLRTRFDKCLLEKTDSRESRHNSQSSIATNVCRVVVNTLF